MKRLYETLQISALSLEKQKKLIRHNFLKNLIISIFFFVAGLLLPNLLTLFL